MILERYFQKRKELKTAKTWIKALETREVQKNSYHNSGDLKQSREFAAAVMQAAEAPKVVQTFEPEPKIPQITIFDESLLPGSRPLYATA